MTTMRELSKLAENSQCADCDAKDPDWTSINLGVFLCIKCAGLHRNLGVHHSKVRSIDLDTSCWDTAQVEFMRGMGNVAARRLYERYAPCFYARPTETESAIVRENWIRAKYVRKEFVANTVENDEKVEEHAASVFLMPEPVKEGFMFKQNPKGMWQKRWFILHLRNLYYFDDPDESYANGCIDLMDVTTVVPETPDPAHKNMFIIQAKKKGDRKDYPVACERVEDMFSWLHAIRRSQLYYAKLTQSIQEFEEKPVDSNIPFKDMSRIIKSGELVKQGGHWKSWNKRFCVLSNGCLFYFKSKPMNADTPEGGIRLENCDVVDAEAKVGEKHKHTFSVIAPKRVYFFSADSAAEMHEWMSVIRTEIERLNPREKCDFVSMRVLK